jgi:two-component system response regulator PilR (NtrC family)
MRQVIKLPSLEERKEDLEAVSSQILTSLQRSMRLSELRLEPEAIKALADHKYVENFRELEALLQRAVIESKTGVIRKEDLHFRLNDLNELLPFSIPIEEGWGRLEFLYRSLERDLIQRALEKYPQSSNTQIASILGTTRRILELRMKSYDIHEG